MSDIDQYLHAATRDNTRRSYQAAVHHYEVGWGGFLPATADSIVRYLADHGNTLSANTLQLRLSAIAQWHVDQGFPDPTKAPLVRKVLKGIRELHPAQEKRARPLQVEELAALTAWLDKRVDRHSGNFRQNGLRLLFSMCFQLARGLDSVQRKINLTRVVSSSP